MVDWVTVLFGLGPCANEGNLAEWDAAIEEYQSLMRMRGES